MCGNDDDTENNLTLPLQQAEAPPVGVIGITSSPHVYVLSTQMVPGQQHGVSEVFADWYGVYNSILVLFGKTSETL